MVAEIDLLEFDKKSLERHQETAAIHLSSLISELNRATRVDDPVSLGRVERIIDGMTHILESLDADASCASNGNALSAAIQERLADIIRTGLEREFPRELDDTVVLTQDEAMPLQTTAEKLGQFRVEYLREVGPETLLERAPVFGKLAAANSKRRNSHEKMTIRSRKAVSEVLNLMKDGKLQTWMLASGTRTLELAPAAAGRGVRLLISAEATDEFPITKYVSREAVCRTYTKHDHEAGYVVEGLYERFAVKKLEKELGITALSDLWKGFYADETASSLLRVLGYRIEPDAVRSGYWVKQDETPSKAREEYRAMLRSGLLTMLKRGDVTVEYGAMSDDKVFHAPCGPQTREEYASRFPQGLRGHSLLYYPGELIEGLYFPREFAEIPAFLEKQGLHFEPGTGEWAVS